MSALHSMKKEIAKNGKRFYTEMYNTLLGSFLISLKILNSTDLSDFELKQLYKREKKHWLKGEVNEQTWMEDLVETMNKKKEGKTHIPYGQIALVVSNYNMLVAPALIDGDKVNVLPLREDGFMGPTLTYGKVYPIVEEIEK